MLCSVQSDGAARLTNPAERLLEKRREIFKVQNELDEQKIIYQQKVSRRWGAPNVPAGSHCRRPAYELKAKRRRPNLGIERCRSNSVTLNCKNLLFASANSFRRVMPSVCAPPKRLLRNDE